MKIVSHKVNKKSKLEQQGKYLRIFRTGCGLDTCHCSDGLSMSMSDGNTHIRVEFKDREEMNKYLHSETSIFSEDEHDLEDSQDE